MVMFSSLQDTLREQEGGAVAPSPPPLGSTHDVVYITCTCIYDTMYMYPIMSRPAHKHYTIQVEWHINVHLWAYQVRSSKS